MRRRAFVDGVAGLRHAEREQDRLAAERHATRVRWSAFCMAWLYIGTAFANGYGPGVR